MKKIVLSLIIGVFLPLQLFASFSTSYTNITGDTSFTKSHGIDELRVSEDYLVNPFAGSVIRENETVCTGNSCPCGPSGCSFIASISVDGTIFNTSHPKYINDGDVRRDWYNYADGIESREVYIADGFSMSGSIFVPDQTVQVRKYYRTMYRHDVTPPTCGTVNYYNDLALTVPFTYSGGWLNSPKYFTMVCNDSETGCYCDLSDPSCEIRAGQVISTPQLLGHNIKPQVNFTNRVRLTDPTCEPGGTFQKVLFDLKTPKFDIALGGNSFDLNQESLRDYKVVSGSKLDGIETTGIVEFTRSGSINRLAGDTFIDLEIEDSFLTGSVHGVSGLQEYDFSITRLTDTSFRTIPPQVLSACGRSSGILSEYNPTGSVETGDLASLSFNCNDLQTAGEYLFTFEATDWAGNITIAGATVNIYPNVISIADSTLVITSTPGIKYANNVDTYDYEFSLRDQYGNPLFNRIFNSNPSQSIDLYSGGQTILMRNGNSGFRYDYTSTQTDIEGIYRFQLKSLYPGSFTHRFLFSYNLWDANYIQNGTNISTYLTNNAVGVFNKPISASIVFVGPGDTLELGTEHEYRIDLSNDGGLTSISTPSLDINPSTLSFSSGHRFSDISSLDNTFTLADLECSLTGIFDATGPSSVLQTPELDIDSMDVRYILAGESIAYPLDSFGITGCSISTVGLKTIGSIQGDGKVGISGGENNFSDVSTSGLRSQIRSNAYRLIRGMSSGQTINGVRYVEGDVTVSGDLGYETLIVKNGNVFISGDLNPSRSTIGIIVLKDEGFDLSSDYNISGNIYIRNTVTSINAHLYADGALRSATASGGEYIDGDLGTKLRMKGSLFTRNTVGGGLLAGTDYLLPGGTPSTNLELASIYDLNYIRRAQICGEIDDYSFLIEYDQNIQNNPPKGFTTN